MLIFVDSLGVELNFVDVGLLFNTEGLKMLRNVSLELVAINLD